MSWTGLFRWEWFKFRGRRILWVLLALLLFLAATIVLVRFGDYQFLKDRTISDEAIFLPGTPRPEDDVIVDCETLVATGTVVADFPPPLSVEDVDIAFTTRECEMEIVDIDGRLDALVEDFTLPGAIPKALRWTALFAIPMIAFVTVLVIGSEYSWGTLRTMLMRGPGRERVLATKLGLVATLMLATWILITLVIIVTSLIATALISEVSHGDWSGAVIWDVVRDVARAWYATLPYIALAALLSVLFSSWTSGTLLAAAVAAGYFFFELFSVGRIIKLFEDQSAFGWVGTAAEYDLGWNTAAWMFGRGGEPISGFALAGAIGVADYPGEIHAFGVQLVFLVGILALTFWLFRRRDVAGPSG